MNKSYIVFSGYHNLPTVLEENAFAERLLLLGDNENASVFASYDDALDAVYESREWAAKQGYEWDKATFVIVEVDMSGKYPKTNVHLV